MNEDNAGNELSDDSEDTQDDDNWGDDFRADMQSHYDERAADRN